MDCAFCEGLGCILKQQCQRYQWHRQAVDRGEGHPWQSYVLEPFDPATGTCEAFLRVANGEESE